MPPSSPVSAPVVIAGRYQLEEELGRGGMGAVHRARDLRTGQGVALKRSAARDVRKLDRRKALLEREYHTLAQLAHPRIIEVYDYGVDERGPYYTMELLDGADLDKGGRLPWREACSVLCDVSSSLAILHSRGLLHRDVSARNVRRTADGRVKLLDFGAMTTMGSSKEVVGTPPFVAPEALALQGLDARADLYSLGALAYYVLTGRHAYPARRLGELRDAWRSRPTPPSRVVPELPAALSSLVLQLLSLDRGARPQSAAEVMERLCAIAELPMEERADVGRAYLSTPTLVGREQALLAIRRRMLALVRGEGGVLVLEGAEGSGRSRLLDACVLEAKLLGAIVLRGGGSDTADFAVARELCTQLMELFPVQAGEAARLSRHVLYHVLPELRAERWSIPPSAPDRSVILRELRDFVLQLCRGQRIVLVVDDVDRCDEPSAALLAALADKVDRHAVVVAASLSRDTRGVMPPSIKLLRELSDLVPVDPLSAEQTESLLRAVFGDVDNLSLVAGRIQALSRGNPRATMELAQHLVDRGAARYQAGSWSLPREAREGDLPASHAASLADRLDRLSADAHELSAALALCDGDSIALDDYAGLCAHGDARRVFGALDELVAARVLVVDGVRYRFAQRGFVPVLLERASQATRRAVHGRIADTLTRLGARPVRRIPHLLQAAREREAIELLSSLDMHALFMDIAWFERAIEGAERLAMPARVVHELRSAVIARAPIVMAVDAFHRHLPKVLERLERDSGLSDYRELAELPAAERLPQALARAQARYEATPEGERVYPIIDAIRELARFSANFTSLAMQLFQIDLFERLPPLEPLMPLSPALASVGKMIEASKLTLAGSSTEARARYDQILERLAQPDRGGFDDTYYSGITHAIHYLLGLLKASIGSSDAERHAQLLDRDREHRVNAWRVRVSLHLNRGDADEARKAQRRAELLQLQQGAEQRYLGTSVGIELLAFAQIGDLIGVKRSLEQVGELARHFQGWRPLQAIGQCHYRLLQGDPNGALEALQPTLGQIRAGSHPYFCYLAAVHVTALSELGRADEAVAQGEVYYAQCMQVGIDAHLRWLQRALALACAAAGKHEQAIAVLTEAIAPTEALGVSGLPLGALYEARAWVAAGMQDTAAFEHYAELCATEYKKVQNLALNAKFARLLVKAKQHDLGRLDLANHAAEMLVASQTETAYESIHSRMLECVDGEDRARCALTMLLQSIGTTGGQLYAVRLDGSLQLLACVPDEPIASGLHAWLEECVRFEIDSSQTSAMATADVDGEIDAEAPYRSEVSARFTDAQGRSFEPVFLTAGPEHGNRVAALLALPVLPGPRSLIPKDLIAEITDFLVEQGDLAGLQ